MKEERVGQGSGRARGSVSVRQPGPPLPGALSPVCHQHLDDEVGQENQEGAGYIVFEGRKGR